MTSCLAGVRALGINVLMLALIYAPHCFFDHLSLEDREGSCLCDNQSPQNHAIKYASIAQ